MLVFMAFFRCVWFNQPSFVAPKKWMFYCSFCIFFEHCVRMMIGNNNIIKFHYPRFSIPSPLQCSKFFSMQLTLLSAIFFIQITHKSYKKIQNYGSIWHSIPKCILSIPTNSLNCIRKCTLFWNLVNANVVLI